MKSRKYIVGEQGPELFVPPRPNRRQPLLAVVLVLTVLIVAWTVTR